MFLFERASPQKTLTLEVTDLIFCHDQAILVLDFFFHNKTKKEPHNIAVTQFWVVPWGKQGLIVKYMADHKNMEEKKNWKSEKTAKKYTRKTHNSFAEKIWLFYCAKRRKKCYENYCLILKFGTYFKKLFCESF